MLLKQLLIKDFRIFKGKHRISFATEKDRNVTIIMGDNGTGKTTLAQVFTWCLYGETTFEDKVLLCMATSNLMLPNSEENVYAELVLVHNEVEYTIISDQKYKKDSNGIIKPTGQRSFTIAFKKADGTREYVKELDRDIRIKEILPRELSRYFFFDGERIGNMSKEIRRGRSQEFAGAVQSLLGLSAYKAALFHLKGKNSNSVYRVYEQSYDTISDDKMAEYVKKVEELNNKIINIDTNLSEITIEKANTQDIITELTEKIEKNKSSEELARRKKEYIKKCEELKKLKAVQIKSVLRMFNNSAPGYFSKKLIKDSLEALSKTEKIDKGVPSINDKTIQYLINRGKCICGSEVKTGNDAFIELTKLLDYIPPKSVGNIISEFVNLCEVQSKSVQDYFQDFCDSYKPIREYEHNYLELQEEIHKIENLLVEMENVGDLQAKLSQKESHNNKLDQIIIELNQDKGGCIAQLKEIEVKRKELANISSINKKIEVYKTYTQYLFDQLLKQYTEEESQMRVKLEDTVNELFKRIYNGGFSLSLDEKYNIQININDNSMGKVDDIETSTAQNISVIFAFIAGVIKMARNNRDGDNNGLTTEPYPLVMDAPLSAFDKKRIKTVCEVLPNVAEQIIVFIKDTDGDIAQSHLGSKIGKMYRFEKKSEIEGSII